MEKCKYYRTDVRQSPRYNVRTGQYTHSVDEEYSYCTGTREQDECDCGGCRGKCTHYPETRKEYEENLNRLFKSNFKNLSYSIDNNAELVKSIICFSDKHCESNCSECSLDTDNYTLDDTIALFSDILEHLRKLNNVIKEQQEELNVTRQFVARNNLTFELLKFTGEKYD